VLEYSLSCALLVVGFLYVMVGGSSGEDSH
jgi:hypothetical protein